MPGPQIIVPGNHDISLYNVFRRFVQPLDRYKRYITDDLDPIYVDDEIAVMGVNTARSLTFKDGRVNKEQVAAIRAQLGGPGPRTSRASSSPTIRSTCRRTPTRATWSTARRWRWRRLPNAASTCCCRGTCTPATRAARRTRYQMSEYAALVVQAGTATSTRGRGEVNSFNVVRVEHDRVEVDRYGWDVLGKTFSLMTTEKFLRIGNMWAAHTDGLYAAGM